MEVPVGNCACSGDQRKKVEPDATPLSPWGWANRQMDPTAADFVLFAHLIPCCQHFVADSEPKVAFEAAMNARKARFGAHDRFLEYLLNHPVNRGIGQTLASKDLTVGERSASWELVICLMRNILCHEYCFGWSSVREMMRVSLAHFGGRREVEQLLHLYATLVLLPPSSSPPPSPSSPPPSSGPDDATSSRSSSDDVRSGGEPCLAHLSDCGEELWRDLLLFAQLIPCRSNNAIVDIQFEEEMSAMADTKGFGDWEVFAEYLKTHPANPQQWITPSHDISWMMVIRLMRNILCHERSMRFDGLRQFARKTLDYFGERAHFHDFLALYQAHCRGRPRLLAGDDDDHRGLTVMTSPSPSSAEPVSALRLFPAAQIQTALAHNFCVWERPAGRRCERGLFCGLRPLQAFVRKCLAAAPPSNPPALLTSASDAARARPARREKIAALITGVRGGGRTSAALVMAHHITNPIDDGDDGIDSHVDADTTHDAAVDQPAVDADNNNNERRIVYVDCGAPEHAALRSGGPRERIRGLLRLLSGELDFDETHSRPQGQREGNKKYENENEDEDEEESDEAMIEVVARKVESMPTTRRGAAAMGNRVAVILDDYHAMVVADEGLTSGASGRAELLVRLHEAIADLAAVGVFFILTSTPCLALYLYYFAAADDDDRHSPGQPRPASEAYGGGGKRKVVGHASTDCAQKRAKTAHGGLHSGQPTTRPTSVADKVRVRNCLKGLHVYDIPGEAGSEGELKATELLLRHYLPTLHKHHLKAILHHLSAAQVPLHPALLASTAVAWCLADEQAQEQATVFTVALVDPTRPVVHDRLLHALAAVHGDVASLLAVGGGGDYVGLLHAYASEGGEERPKGALWASLLAKDAEGRWRLKDVYLTTVLHFYVDREEVEAAASAAGLKWRLKPLPTASGLGLGPPAPSLPPVVLLTHAAHLWRVSMTPG